MRRCPVAVTAQIDYQLQEQTFLSRKAVGAPSRCVATQRNGLRFHRSPVARSPEHESKATGVTDTISPVWDLQIGTRCFRGAERLIALRETVVRIAVTGVYRPSAISALLSSKAVAAIRMQVKEALRNKDDSEARAIKAVMPILEQAGCDLIATGVEETHEAASLIDLDLKLAEGSFIAPTRIVGSGEVSPDSAGGLSTA